MTVMTIKKFFLRNGNWQHKCIIFFPPFSYIKLIWQWEIAETHVGRPHSLAFDNCSADLQVRTTIEFYLHLPLILAIWDTSLKMRKGGGNC